ncbi:MAG: biotin--[acetyl-CoA-carboxylase] ligase [Verrucomicrobia bacterium]|jgi:BirA family biotin operon repressor/biotin-[acetyl-CoA-carboxylase] ligase|nr:biotin--[acetyl-CoA-carboxylase] ligase [Verrucomicrobiota bacterium]
MNLDLEILKALRAPDGGWVSGSDLSRALGVTRAAVWGRIEDLRSMGYEIEASPHQGYRLIATPDALHADDLMARLPGDRVIGRDIRVFKETASTNDMVEKLARDGAAEGAVVFAESQTRGRGRLGRSWSSPAGQGLWFSVLLRPAWRPQEITRLTVAAATALRRAIRSVTRIETEIKWPNDLLIQGRKVAGILTELSAETDRVRYVVLGVGIDVNQTASDFPGELSKVAGSLRLALGQRVDRPALATAVLRELDRDYARVCHGQFQAIAEEWESGCSTLGRTVQIRIGDRRLVGRAESLDPDGALLLRTQHGHLECITGGDLTLEKQ